jgi:hypothetical protein
MARRRRRGRKRDSSLSSEEEFRQEYAYVIRDLRHIFLLAGVMFALLILTNLLLQ